MFCFVVVVFKPIQHYLDVYGTVLQAVQVVCHRKYKYKYRDIDTLVLFVIFSKLSQRCLDMISQSSKLLLNYLSD